MTGLTGISVSPSSTIRRHGFTCKKVQHRGDFMADIAFFNMEQLVWLDETGCERRDHIRKLGYAMRELRPTCNRFLHRGKGSQLLLPFVQME